MGLFWGEFSWLDKSFKELFEFFRKQHQGSSSLHESHNPFGKGEQPFQRGYLRPSENTDITL